MRTLLMFILLLCITCARGQAPSVVIAVGGTNLEPYSNAQEWWVNNQWNGLFFYQGKGTPTKLCVTDGTTAGTKFLANTGAGNVHKILPAKDFVYVITIQTVSFSPFTNRYEIWKTDGSAAGTSHVFTLPDAAGISNGDQFCSDPSSLFNFSMDGNSNIFYFSAYDAATGNELWVTDGTAAGTHIVKDIKPGGGGSFPWGFFKIGNEVFFNCTEIGFERKLWKTDGTAAGTVQVPVAEPFFIVNGSIGKMGNKMILFAHNTVNGYEPYVSDGTAAGTFMLADINPGSANSLLPYVEEANLKSNSRYCFLVLQNGVDTSLYRTDGSSAGTIRVAGSGMSVYTRISSGGYSDVDENGLWVVQFNNAGSGNAEKIYRSDGTVNGTYSVAANISYGQKVKIYNNALWMQARDMGSVANVEPWRSGGNAVTTNKAFEISPGNAGSPTFTPYSSNPYGFFVRNGKLYFFATPVSPSSHNLYEYTGNFTFNGTVPGGRWSDSANWNGRMPPGITDTAYVNAGTPHTLHINGATAYAGTLVLGNNAAVNIINAADSLIVNTRIQSGANNLFTGNGVLALNHINADSAVHINNGFTAERMTVAGHVQLQTGDLVINQQLNLLNNKQLTLNSGNITLAGTAGTVTQTGNSYIHTNGTGRLFIENIGASGRTGAVVFHVGTAAAYNPATITNAGTADKFGVRVMPGISSSYTGETAGAPYSNAAVNATWLVTEAVTGGSDVTLQLQWNQLQELPGFDRAQSHLGHYTSGSWSLGSNGAAAGSNPYSFTRAGITSFSPFGILNNNATLPLTFVFFRAQNCGSSDVCLYWQTANEQQVSHFEIERSTDGRLFTKAGSAAAGGNFYTYTDARVLQSRSLVYYRVKQVDDNGAFKYTPVVLVKSRHESVTVYPTVMSGTLNVQVNGAQNAVLRLFDAGGKQVSQSNLRQGANSLTTTSLRPGVYSYQVAASGQIISSGKLMKQ